MNFDINKLKEKIRAGFPDDLVSSGHFISEKTLLDWIDSLAVEVPEAKPGAIARFIDHFHSDFSIFTKAQTLENEARAELAQLQAELLDYKTAHPKIQLAAIERTREIKNLKGALRTLAKKMQDDCSPWFEKGDKTCRACYEKGIVNCVECLESYALANPTEEVEG